MPSLAITLGTTLFDVCTTAALFLMAVEPSFYVGDAFISSLESLFTKRSAISIQAWRFEFDLDTVMMSSGLRQNSGPDTWSLWWVQSKASVLPTSARTT